MYIIISACYPGNSVYNVRLFFNSQIVHCSLATVISVMIVPPMVGGPPIFTVPENGGPLEVCIQVVTPAGMAVLGRPVTVVLRTEDLTAIGTFL